MKRETSGFTLLELVLVMLIISVLTALAAPSLRGFLAGRKEADAVSEMLALAQYARTQAIGTGAVYRLNVDAAGRTYWLTAQSGADFKELQTEIGRHFSLPDGMKAKWQQSTTGTAPATPTQAAATYFAFYPDGRVEANTLELTGAGGKAIALGCRSESEPLVVLP